MIGPAEIEDILLDLSEALSRTKNVSLERMPAWPVPAKTVFSVRERNEARAPAASQSHSASGGDERLPGPNVRA